MKQFFLALGLVLATFQGFAAQADGPDNVLAFTRVAQVLVSPDGQKTAVVTMKATSTPPRQWRFSLSLVQGKDIQTLVQADHFASLDWSPDGSQLLYIATKAGRNVLAVYDLRQQKSLPILSLSSTLYAAKWSPSGTEIAFVADTPSSSTAPPNALINASSMNQVHPELDLIVYPPLPMGTLIFLAGSPIVQRFMWQIWRKLQGPNCMNSPSMLLSLPKIFFHILDLWSP